MKYRLLIAFFLCLLTGQIHAFPPEVEALLNAQKAMGAVYIFECARPKLGEPMQLISCTFYKDMQETGSLLDNLYADARIVPKTGILYDVWKLTFACPLLEANRAGHTKNDHENQDVLSETGSYEGSATDLTEEEDTLSGDEAASAFTS